MFTRGRVSALLLIFALAIAAWVALAILEPDKADAHFEGYDSVNSSEYMGYTPVTSMGVPVYQAAASWDVWNCAWSASCNGVDIDPVSASPQVLVFDVNQKGNWTGMYSTATNPDYIRMNRYWLKNAPNWEKTQTAAHEFGHALGFDHAPNAYRSQTIMTSCSSCANKSPRPLVHDAQDYYNLWID